MKAVGMSRRLPASQTLAEMQMDLTRQLILNTALEVFEKRPVSELTVRGVAKLAGISERTVFRYFPDREEFLDAIAEEAKIRMEVPPPPTNLEELHNYPRLLFTCFEAKEKLVRASLQGEITNRVRGSQGRDRWVAIKKIIDHYAPKATSHSKKLATANIQYFLNALSWNYHRTFFKFSLEETIECTETAIRNALSTLKK